MSAPRTLLLAGLGHAHMQLLKELPSFIAAGHKVVAVCPEERHYYSGMGPGMLGGFYTPEEISFPVAQMARDGGAEVHLDRITAIRPKKRTVELASGAELAYDVLSVNLGSSVAPRTQVLEGCEDVFPVKPIAELLRAKKRLFARFTQEKGKELAVSVIGGGPAALEVAGNVLALAKSAGASPLPRITIHAGRGFFSRHSTALAWRAKRSLSRRSIIIDESGYIKVLAPGADPDGPMALYNERGEKSCCDLAFLCQGTRPPRIYKDCGLPTGPCGGLAVDQHLACLGYPEIFGGGDTIHFTPHPLDKVGVYAVRQNPVLTANVRARLEGRAPQAFDPGSDDYLLIFNMGDGTGLMRKSFLLAEGRWVFKLKDYIDRKFIKAFSPEAGK